MAGWKSGPIKTIDGEGLENHPASFATCAMNGGGTICYCFVDTIEG
jgi:hypothetical protein